MPKMFTINSIIFFIAGIFLERDRIVFKNSKAKSKTVHRDVWRKKLKLKTSIGKLKIQVSIVIIVALKMLPHYLKCLFLITIEDS